MKAHIRNMTQADTDRVGEILYESFNAGAAKHGYARKMQRVETAKSWAWSMLHYGSNELLIAEVENRIAGICCLNPRGDLGGVGPVVVDPYFQGYRIGSQLMDALLNRAENLQSLRLIQEAFNPASFSLFYSFNFLPVANLLDLFRDGGAGQRLEPCSDVTELTAKDLDAVHTYDSPRSRSERRKDLAYYVRWGKVFVYRHQSQMRGFLACLPGSGAVQLGPLLAEGEEEAGCLFQHASAVFKERDCQTRVMARDYLLVKTLTGFGFKVYCLDNLMVRGAWRPGRHIEAFGIFPEGV